MLYGFTYIKLQLSIPRDPNYLIYHHIYTEVLAIIKGKKLVKYPTHKNWYNTRNPIKARG